MAPPDSPWPDSSSSPEASRWRQTIKTLLTTVTRLDFLRVRPWPGYISLPVPALNPICSRHLVTNGAWAPPLVWVGQTHSCVSRHLLYIRYPFIWGTFYKVCFLLVTTFPLNTDDRMRYYKVTFRKLYPILLKIHIFFFLAARKNDHHFESVAEEDKALIYQFHPVYSGNISSFQQVYIFNWKLSICWQKFE